MKSNLPFRPRLQRCGTNSCGATDSDLSFEESRDLVCCWPVPNCLFVIMGLEFLAHFPVL